MSFSVAMVLVARLVLTTGVAMVVGLMQSPPPWPMPPPRADRRWSDMEVDAEGEPPVGDTEKPIPPPPKWTPQQEAEVRKVIEEHNAKPKAAPVVPLTEAEQQAKKAAKKQRQRQAKSTTGSSSSVTVGLPQPAVEAQVPAVETPIIPVYGEVGVEAQVPAAEAQVPAVEAQVPAVEGSLIPVYGEGDPEAQVPAVEAQAQVGADDTCKPKPKFRCSACGEYVSRHTDSYLNTIGVATSVESAENAPLKPESTTLQRSFNEPPKAHGSSFNKYAR